MHMQIIIVNEGIHISLVVESVSQVERARFNLAAIAIDGRVVVAPHVEHV
jgi:hypothetical protein